MPQFCAKTPSGPPVMLPPDCTIMFPPFARTGPVTAVETFCVFGVQPAQAPLGSPTAISAASEALARSEARQASRAGTDADEPDALRNAAAPSPNSSTRPMDSLHMVALLCRPRAQDRNNAGLCLWRNDGTFL